MLPITAGAGLFSLLFLVAFAFGAAPQSYQITTFAGPEGVVGGVAVSQPIGIPHEVISDGGGGFYFSSTSWSSVYHVGSDGNLAVVAGTGAGGYIGDNGPAAAALLDHPEGLALDPSGNLYVADAFNSRVRKISPDGTITTVAGTGVAGFSGDAAPAVSAQLNIPGGVAFDAVGNLFISDTRNHRVRRVNPEGVIATIAGTGIGGYSGDGGPALSAQLYAPGDLAMDSEGNLYIGSKSVGVVRRVTPAGVISTVAGGGTSTDDEGSATDALLWHADSVAVDADGNLLIAESGAARIRKVTADGAISTIAGTGVPGFSGDSGPADSAQLKSPIAVASAPGGNVLIADSGNFRICAVDSDGDITTLAGVFPDGHPPVFAQFELPVGVAADGAGDVFVIDRLMHRVTKISSSGVVTTVAGTGVAGFSGDGGPGSSAQLNEPQGIAVDAAGNVLIADTFNHRIRKVAPDGRISTVAGGGDALPNIDGIPATAAILSNPVDVAVDALGNFFIADPDIDDRIRMVDTNGTINTVLGNGCNTIMVPECPTNLRAITMDPTGTLYFIDSHQVNSLETDGTAAIVAGSSQGFGGDGGPATAARFNFPRDIVADSSGNLLIADTNNHRIRKIDSAGMIQTIAGNGAAGYSGIGGPATAASLNLPYGIAVDADGNVFVVDGVNSRIRKLAPLKKRRGQITSH